MWRRKECLAPDVNESVSRPDHRTPKEFRPMSYRRKALKCAALVVVLGQSWVRSPTHRSQDARCFLAELTEPNSLLACNPQSSTARNKWINSSARLFSFASDRVAWGGGHNTVQYVKAEAKRR